MPSSNDSPGATPPLPTEEETDKKTRKRRAKVRSAWISFVGRIVAQFVGAAATIGLGLILARHIHRVDRVAGEGSPPPPSSAPARTVARSREGGVSLAVLPFVNLSGDPEQDHFTDGMTEAIITDFAKIRALRVISRTSVMPYKGARKPLPDIARELGVDAVVEGSVARAGGRVRVTAQLIDAASDEHLWAESYDRDVKDVLALQDDVARAIVREVRAALAPLEQERLARTRPVDPAAHALDLKGRYVWSGGAVPERQGAAHFFE